MSRARSRWMAAAILLLAPGWSRVPSLAGNDVVSGEFRVDEPTLGSLGFRWFVDGDDNGNAPVSVRQRPLGATAWSNWPAMLRINRDAAGVDGWVCGNLFAGSVLGLDEG